MRTALSKKDLEAVIQREVAVKLREDEAPTATAPQNQSLPEQIAKYIPAEVVAFYIPVLAAIATLRSLMYGTEPAGLGFNILSWAVFIIGLLGTAYYMHRTAKAEMEENHIALPNQRAIAKAAISTVGFLFWAITLGGPWDFINYYEAIGAVLITIFAFLSTIIYNIIPFPKPSPQPNQ